MNEKIKTAIAFSLLGVFFAAGIILTVLDHRTDVYPDENTAIMLYGEAHGYKEYYDIEVELWKDCYEEGCRNLFVELPYYSAEFINVWMREDSDEKLDKWFEEIHDTLSGNEYYKEFFLEIKEYCPDTVFYGTDIGHQFDTTGARYLKYLEDNGLEDSEKYKLAKECIRQGEEYRNEDTEHNGISSLRETHMVSNFIDAYTRCGGGKIMGIYGSYHTDLENPDLMAGRLKTQYGNVISSVKLSTISFGTRRPYKLGFCITGVVFLLMLFIPNIIWAAGKKPEGYENASANENRFLALLERIGEAGVTVTLLIFPAFDPCIRKLPEGIFFEWRIIFWALAFVLMILYECYWLRYFKGSRTMKDMYSSFAGFPVAGATLPVIAALLLGVYSGNMIMIAVSVILGIGHIGIHFVHKNEAKNDLA